MIVNDSLCPLCGRSANPYVYESCIRPIGRIGCMNCKLTGHVLPDIYPYFPYSSGIVHCRQRRSLRS